MSVENSDDSSLSKYRTNPLDERESNTYQKIDSLGKTEKFDEKANFYGNLLKGKLRLGKVDFNTANFFGYSQYEGLRLGLGTKLNEKFNKYISPDASMVLKTVVLNMVLV